MKQKTTVKITPELPDGAAVISVGDDNSVFASLAASLAEIRKLKGVLGYILRSNTSAIIDLTNRTKQPSMPSCRPKSLSQAVKWQNNSTWQM